MVRMELPEQSFSLDELAHATGFDRRVIRSFIEQGLLRGPETMGRYARYSLSHLERLLAIKALRNARGLPLVEVRRALLAMSGDEIKALATSAQKGAADPPPGPAPPASALDYLRSISAAPRPMSMTRDQPISHRKDAFIDDQGAEFKQVIPDAMTTPLERLVLELSKVMEQRHVRRQARGEAWYRISVTPDVELAVRGIQNPEELARLERIADHLREILLGGL